AATGLPAITAAQAGSAAPAWVAASLTPAALAVASVMAAAGSAMAAAAATERHAAVDASLACPPLAAYDASRLSRIGAGGSDGGAARVRRMDFRGQRELGEDPGRDRARRLRRSRRRQQGQCLRLQ